jgi:hypothetical protein
VAVIRSVPDWTAWLPATAGDAGERCGWPEQLDSNVTKITKCENRISLSCSSDF